MWLLSGYEEYFVLFSQNIIKVHFAKFDISKQNYVIF